MKRKIFTLAIALMGFCATAFAGQEACYGTWTATPAGGLMTETIMISADEITVSFEYNGLLPDAAYTLSDLQWEETSNPDGETASSFPLGYLISGVVTSVSGATASDMLGEQMSFTYFINPNNPALLLNGVDGSIVIDESKITISTSQEACYGTWTRTDESITETVIISADEMSVSYEYTDEAPGFWYVLSNLQWDIEINPDGATASDFPLGYRISGVITSASEDFSFLLGIPMGFIYFINPNNPAQLLDSEGNIYTSKIIDTSSKDISTVAEAKVVGYYTITGQPLPLDAEPKSGLYIVVYDNGTAKKIMKR